MNLQAVLLKLLNPVLRFIPAGWMTAIGILGALAVFLMSPEGPIPQLHYLQPGDVGGWASLVAGVTGVGLIRKDQAPKDPNPQ